MSYSQVCILGRVRNRLGFVYTACGLLVRSSYKAGEFKLCILCTTDIRFLRETFSGP